MTQVEKTEAVISAMSKRRMKDGMIYRERDGAIAHARDLARKLDAIGDALFMQDQYGEEPTFTLAKIRAIIEAAP